MSKFDQFNNQLAKKSQSSLFTGLTAVKVLAINPTTEQLSEIIGADRAEKFNTSYPLQADFQERTVRSINIWVTDKDENVNPTLFSIDLCNEDQVAKTGSLKIVNDYMQDTWSKSIETVIENPKMSWFSKTGIRTAKIGEIDYYKFISQLLRFDFSGEVAFSDFLTQMEIDYDTVYGGNYNGLHELVEYANGKGFVFAGVFIVKDAGEGKFYQEFLKKSESWFRLPSGEVNMGLEETFLQRREVKQEEGYDFTSRLYTVKFQDFVKSECFNSEPLETAEEDSWMS